LIVAGTVAEYTSPMLDSIAEMVATELGVAPGAVSVSVEAASVRIIVRVSYTSEAEMQTGSTTLNQAVSSRELATSFLRSVPGLEGTVVEEDPVVAISKPFEPPTVNDVAIAISGLGYFLLAIFVAWFLCFRRGRKGTTAGQPQYISRADHPDGVLAVSAISEQSASADVLVSIEAPLGVEACDDSHVNEDEVHIEAAGVGIVRPAAELSTTISSTASSSVPTTSTTATATTTTTAAAPTTPTTTMGATTMAPPPAPSTTGSDGGAGDALPAAVAAQYQWLDSAEKDAVLHL
jgi:hypothetical protein